MLKGCVSHMVRAMAAHVPAHFSLVGIGTTVDPNGSVTLEEIPSDFFMKGGKMNQLTVARGEDLVSELNLNGHRYLAYKVYTEFFYFQCSFSPPQKGHSHQCRIYPRNNGRLRWQLISRA